jgi:hypothetical protein
MANRRYRPTQTIYEDEESPAERYDVSKKFKSSIRSNPRLQSSFDYSQLDEKYPIKSIAGRIQLEEKRKAENPYREEELQYKMQLIKERENELKLKGLDRELDMYDAKLAREDAMLEQVPLARKALGSLDPRSQDYLQKRMDVYNQFPVAFEYAPFVTTVDQPLIQRHKSLTTRTEKSIPMEEYEAASGVLQNEELNAAAKAGDRFARTQILSAQRTADMFEQQEGLSSDQDQQQSVPISNQVEMDQPSSDQIYSDAMNAIRERPDKKDVINRRLIEIGLSPIE